MESGKRQHARQRAVDKGYRSSEGNGKLGTTGTQRNRGNIFLKPEEVMRVIRLKSSLGEKLKTQHAQKMRPHRGIS